MDEITEQDWDELMTVNVKSCFLVTRAFVPAMRERQWGRIILVLRLWSGRLNELRPAFSVVCRSIR